MKDMYANKKLAIVHAAGVPSALRSHFEVQAMAATGVADNEAATTTGWLARHLLAKGGARNDFSAVSDGNGLTAPSTAWAAPCRSAASPPSETSSTDVLPRPCPP